MTTCVFIPTAVHSVYSACFRERLSVCACVSFSLGYEDEMWDLIVLVPDHCLSFYFTSEF